MTTKKLGIMVLAMLVVSAFSAVVVASAPAANLLAEWLVGAGNPIAVGESLAVATEGFILLSDKKTFFGNSAVLCLGIADGFLLADGEGEITAILNSAGTSVSGLPGTALLGTGAGSDCVTENLCLEGTSASPIEVWPEELPWKTLLVLTEGGAYLLIVFGTKYEILCLEVFDLNAEDLCTFSEASVEVANDVNGDAEVVGGSTAEPLGECSLGGASSAENTADELALMALLGGELLAVSSEP
jgi:hypothetical protein